MHTSNLALDSRARRAARRIGYVVRKSRRHAGSLDNFGEFMILDPSMNFPVAGFRYDLGPQEVIEWCAE